MLTGRVAVLVLAAAGWLGTAACSDSVTPCTVSLTCTYAGGDGDGGGPVVPSDCDLSKSPKDSASCVTDTVGVFVAPTGDDNANGSKSAPLKTVGKGLAVAASRGLPRVYVCDGSYTENVEITKGVALFGGLSCSWTPSNTKPRIAPASGIALKITKVADPVLVQDIELDGQADKNVPGDSAIGLFASESGNVTLRDALVVAGAGTAGAEGRPKTNYSGVTAAVGGNAVAPDGGTGAKCTCTDQTSSAGGNGSNSTGAGLTDGTANPAVGTSNAGSSTTASCGPGTIGAGGLGGVDGTTTKLVGTLSAAGWSSDIPTTSAPNGHPGQGGGGGGTKQNSSSPGGGGGCGGCGGAGGTDGAAGGSSFAVLSFNATVTIDASLLTSGAGGKGGKGGDGQQAQAGGAGGTGLACDGGPGGPGGGGTGGGGGAGGHSASVAFVGIEPRLTGGDAKQGAPGESGAGGLAGTSTGNAGKTGVAGPIGKAQSSLGL